MKSRRDVFTSPIIIKVGGSLFDLPDLGRKLVRLLSMSGMNEALLVPGGGPTANAVREWDRCHRLGEETSHWLALQALSLNARFLANLLPAETSQIVGNLDLCHESRRQGRVPIVDPYAVARADEGRPGCLPHCWSVTSDSLAARIAILVQARQLLLLKSTTIPEGIDWAEAGRRGFVDPFFADLIGKNPAKPIEVRAVNFRQWAGTCPFYADFPD